jgi:hypothetical protein
MYLSPKVCLSYSNVKNASLHLSQHGTIHLRSSASNYSPSASNTIRKLHKALHFTSPIADTNYQALIHTYTNPPRPKQPAEILSRQVPSYSTVPYIIGGGAGGSYYLPKCGISYFGQSMYPYWHTTNASSYLNCLNLCDNDDTCVMFSFNTSVFAPTAPNNCLIIEQENWHGIDPPHVGDANVNSGSYDIADSQPPSNPGSSCC